MKLNLKIWLMEEDGEKKDLLMNNNPNILIYQNENGNIKVDVIPFKK